MNKKKLKDFTEEELDKYCDTHNCKECPLDTNTTLCLAFDEELWGDVELDYE